MVRVRDQPLDLPLQQSPGGMGFPCGQVFGCPRNVQMRWSNSGLMMCSNLQALGRRSESWEEKSVLEEALGQPVTPDNVACALAAHGSELHFPVLHLH